MELTHRPKGRMCQQCKKANDNCSELDFKAMRKIGVDKDGVIVVACNKYRRVE